MKQVVSLILSIVMVLTMFSVVGFAVELPFASGYVYDVADNQYYWELSENGVLTITGEGAMQELKDSPDWLQYNVTELVIGEGITAIPEEAFLNAKELESVKLSSTVKVIGERAFYDCEKLVSIDFQSVEKIDSMAFYGCMALYEIRLPETLTELGNYAFGYYCNEELDDALAKIDGVTIFAKQGTVAKQYAEENEISYVDTTDYSDFFEYLLVDESDVIDEAHAVLTAYKGCPYTTDIIIPEEIEGYKVEALGENLFSGSDITSVYIPATVKDISVTAFENTSELTEILCEEGGRYGSLDGVLYVNDFYILYKVPEAKTEIKKYPENIRTINDYSFRNSKVKHVELPETVVNLRENAFSFSNLERIVIPESVELICEFCFYGCDKLNEVIIPESVKEIGANAFGNCTALENIYLPYGIECIDGAAFHCTGLKSVVIPDSVSSIGNYAFGYYSADDIEFVKDEEFKIQGRGGTAAEKYAIENGFKFADISPKQPKIFYGYTDKVSVTLFWEQTEDAEFYEVYRRTEDADFKKVGEVQTLEDTVFCDTTVENGNVYTYSIVAVKDNLKSSVYLENYDIEFVSLDTPELVCAELTETGIYVEWKTVSDAEGYILYRKTEDTEWEDIADFKGKVKSFEDTTCQGGEIYSYTVKAYKGEIESGCDYDGVSTIFLDIPKLKAATNATKGIKVTWERVKGATGYIVGRRTISTGWTKIATLDDVDSYIDKTAKTGTEYAYTVVPVYKKITGFFDTAGVRCKRISKVITESATNTEYGVKITWEPVSKCSGYRVYRKTENGSYKRIATVKGSTKSYYTDKTAKSGTKYIYKVVAYSGDYTSYYTEVSRYYLDNPELLSAKSSKKGVTAKWEAVKGASGYYVYRKEGSGSYKKITTVKGGTKDSYLDKSAKKGKTYTYKVKAYYSKTTSAYSNTKSVKDKY